ncbi:MAG: hypothetical protein K8R77_05795 [Anaerolineaceae bacterium]|nr:hypothetical protein [Anaerolineaceae bacterium]
MTSLEVFYLLCAITGGVLFTLRAIMFFVAGGFDAEFGSDMDGADAVDVDFDGDMNIDLDLDGAMDLDLDGVSEVDFDDIAIGDVGDVDADGMDAAYTDTDVSFKFISLQGLTAFFMMFGLAGLALSKSAQPDLVSLMGGIIAGAFTVWVISRIFIGAQKLQSEGTLNMQNAIGLSGTVYLTIPAGDIGKVNIILQGALKEFNAVAADKQLIKTGERVQVVGLTTHEVLVVERIDE